MRFDRCVRLMLVPARRDLDAETFHGVWWSAQEVAQFRFAAAKFFLKNNKGAATMMPRSRGLIVTSNNSSSGDVFGRSEDEMVKDAAGGTPIGMPPLPLPNQDWGQKQ